MMMRTKYGMKNNMRGGKQIAEKKILTSKADDMYRTMVMSAQFGHWQRRATLIVVHHDHKRLLRSIPTPSPPL